MRAVGCERKTVTRFDGDFEDYRDRLLDEIEASAGQGRVEQTGSQGQGERGKLLAAKKRRRSVRSRHNEGVAPYIA